MRDIHSREIDYIRISVTDRCNLRCRYCMPSDGIKLVEHDEMLTFEEITSLMKSFGYLGIKKIKITGGEPLVRKGVGSLIRDLKALPHIEQVTMTTNGVLLKDFAVELWEAGIDGINISLDTLNPQKYKEITGYDAFYDVLDGLNKCMDLNIKTKINAVTLKGINDDEVAELAGIAYRKPIDVRFIEMMPIGIGKDFVGYSNANVLETLKKEFGEPEIVSEKRGNGPAEYYYFKDFKGNVGLISPMTHKFCSNCNRIRLTSTGELRTCLAVDGGIDVKELMRMGLSGQMMDLVTRYVYNKPMGHSFETTPTNDVMRGIGG